MTDAPPNLRTLASQLSQQIHGRPPRLRSAELELTTRCPLRCITCGSHAGQARPDELSTARWLELIDELAALGAKTVTLLGGEPLAHPDLCRFIDRIVQLRMSVDLITSGVGLTPEKADEVHAAGLRAATVSFDGPPELHDHQRGRTGAFDAAQTAVALFGERGISVGACTQVNRANLGALDDLGDVLEELGVVGWQLQYTLPMGRADDAGLAVRPADVPEVLTVVRRLSQRARLRPTLTDSMGYWTDDDVQLRTPHRSPPRCWLGCSAGLRHVGISSDGDVHGCAAMQGTPPEGNVRTQTLRSVWQQQHAFAYSRQFCPSQLSGPCAKCELGVLCRGGCVAASLAFHQTTGRQDRCFRACTSHEEELSP